MFEELSGTKEFALKQCDDAKSDKNYDASGFNIEDGVYDVLEGTGVCVKRIGSFLVSEGNEVNTMVLEFFNMDLRKYLDEVVKKLKNNEIQILLKTRTCEINTQTFGNSS